MRKAVACGIDFGTTNSSVSIAYDNGDVELVTIDTSTPMPRSLSSIAYIDREDAKQAGQEAVKQFMITGPISTACGNCDLVKIIKFGGFAHYDTDCKQHQPGGRCQDARLVSGVKSLLAPTENGTTHAWARYFELEDFVAIIIKELKKRVDDIAGANIRRVVLGYPVTFVGAEGSDYENLQEGAEGRLQRAAEKAGFTDIEFFPEPAAVLLDQYLKDGYILAVDFGGGTYDVAVLENQGSEPEIVALQGATIGGEKFDGLLFDKKVADAIGLNQKPKGKTLPKWIKINMRTLAGIPILLKNPFLLSTLLNFESLGANIDAIREILFGGHAYSFYTEVERAKIELSESQVAQIRYHVQGRIDVSATVYRTDFDRWISSYLDRVDTATITAVNKAGVAPQDVHTVLRAGGSSKIPQFIDRLESIFPNAEIRERPAFTSVAYGLGVHALEVWSNV